MSSALQGLGRCVYSTVRSARLEEMCLFYCTSVVTELLIPILHPACVFCRMAPPFSSQVARRSRVMRRFNFSFIMKTGLRRELLIDVCQCLGVFV